MSPGLRGVPPVRDARARRGRNLALALFVAWHVRPAPARAEPLAPLEWTSPRVCPDVAAVSRSLDGLLEIETARWDRFRRVRGQVVPLRTGGFELVLVFETPSATRERRFLLRDCADSADLAAAALALALDPRSDGFDAALAAGGMDAGRDGDAMSSAGPPALASAGDGEPLASSSSAVDDDAEPNGTTPDAAATRPGDPAPRDRQVPLHFDVGVAGVLDPSGLGEVSFGVSAWGMVRRGRYSLGVHADGLPRASLDVGWRQVRLGLAAAGLRTCYAVSPALGVCPELEAGLLRAAGDELENGSSALDPWLAAGLSLGIRAAALEAVSVVSRVALLVPLVRAEYLVNGGELLHRTPPLVLRLSLGFELPVL